MISEGLRCFAEYSLSGNLVLFFHFLADASALGANQID